MPNTVIRYVARFNGPKSEGRLWWDRDSYLASSGPDGEGTIPVGEYDIKTDGVVDNPTGAYCVEGPTEKTCFFIPLEPRAQINRDGFGIHPDGKVPELFGGLVLTASASRSFWSKWKPTAKANLPELLKVEEQGPIPGRKEKRKAAVFKSPKTSAAKKSRQKR